MLTLLRYYYITEVKASDGQTLYNVTNAPYGSRDWNNIFETRQDAEKYKRQLNTQLDLIADEVNEKLRLP